MENKIISLEELGKRLMQVRECLGLTQKELAEMFNKTQNTISLIENGKSASINTLLPLLSFYSQHIYLNHLFTENFEIIKIDNLYKNNIGGVIQSVLKEGFTKYNRKFEL